MVEHTRTLECRLAFAIGSSAIVAESVAEGVVATAGRGQLSERLFPVVRYLRKGFPRRETGASGASSRTE